MAILEVGQEVVAESEAARPTETTRLLCAAAYIEPTFAQEVVEEFLEEARRITGSPWVFGGEFMRSARAGG